MAAKTLFHETVMQQFKKRGEKKGLVLTKQGDWGLSHGIAILVIVRRVINFLKILLNNLLSRSIG